MNELNPITDRDLVEKVQSSRERSSSLGELIERHSGIYISTVNSYFSNGGISQEKRELLQEKDYHIYMAALKYDPERGTKFSTHLGNETKWICLNYFNKNKTKQQKEVEYKDEQRGAHGQNSPTLDLEKDELIERIFTLAEQHPDPRVKKIFTLRYIVGEGNKVMAWDRVSRQLRISIQGCINIHNRAIAKIKTQLEEYNAK